MIIVIVMNASYKIIEIICSLSLEGRELERGVNGMVNKQALGAIVMVDPSPDRAERGRPLPQERNINFVIGITSAAYIDTKPLCVIEFTVLKSP